MTSALKGQTEAETKDRRRGENRERKRRREREEQEGKERQERKLLRTIEERFERIRQRVLLETEQAHEAPPPSTPLTTVLPCTRFSGRTTGFTFGTVGTVTGYIRDSPQWACSAPCTDGCRWCAKTHRDKVTHVDALKAEAKAALVDRRRKEAAAAAAVERRQATAAEAQAERLKAAEISLPRLSEIPEDWHQSQASSMQTWKQWSLNTGWTTPGLFAADEGVPSAQLREITAKEVREDGELLVDQVGWSRMPQHHAHPNGRIHEDLPAVLMADDPVVYEANVTDHIAVDHWHHLQTDTATSAGADFKTMEGPSPDGGFGDGPESWEAMHIDPVSTWTRASAAVGDSADQINDLVTRGIPLRPNAVTGGKDGVRYGFEALHPQYRRVQWKDVDGVPQVRKALLPDADTEMDMDGLYRECIQRKLPDMEIISLIRLYGVTSFSTGATGVDVLQNYKMNENGMAHIQADRLSKLTTFAKPRLGKPCRHPNGFPYRNHSKAVIEQAKPISKAYPTGMKLRTVTDGGAVRQHRAGRLRTFTKKKMARVIESVRATAEGMKSPHEQFQWGGVHQQADTDLGMTWQHKITSILRSTTTEYVTADGEVKTVMSRKGKPGDDSVNACIPWTIERCKYASFSKYLQALDVLISSGLEVITIHDDFASYYELFALGEFDKWYSGQIVSAEGSDQGLRCEFGISHLPDYLNRSNFMMCEVIDSRAQERDD